ncbi:molybdenum cofactor guanylyltransferase [Brevibacillus composti]|uniref:Molybdenum cofactor guanylyltransferase n=2 Tax=Brevibacillus composti TaxID=2796470 RepID=A0A7T5EQ68_9BACL|nr:molybdenum cofactor guanylyltransferase [Brevibacillus composti]QUO43745.1 molybdenum cofactor guanylyltransferase [Brevibacillus composti]
MGTPKELLEWRGRTLIAHLQQEIAGTGLPCLIVSNRPETLIEKGQLISGADVEITRDLVPSAGPVSGIVTAFRMRSEEVLLMLSCDLPFAERSQLRRLIAFAGQAGSWDAVVVRAQERLHPLFALYHRRTQDHFEEALQAGQYRLMDVLQKLRVVETPPGLIDPWAACNVNTPEEYRAALREQKKRESER